MITQTLERRGGAARSDDRAGASAGGRADDASGDATSLKAGPKTGSALLCEALQAHGVTTIFGYPGGAALPLYRELANHRESLRHVLVRHEENAALAADGYARATGFP